ncbi:3-deoxy-D-manno-octulosonic acid transferase [Derxia gummosa]|uniref:3-deoxy-D-manno-octulosonic acid transferase n=1 Tax=Derxia gummosa DSM 723 TaxID=1121388 RepID=A0A9U5C6C0_9BURK|nr:3-deoxy-D-manno-octulosonic acid transferase [Derxia gummosa]
MSRKTPRPDARPQGADAPSAHSPAPGLASAVNAAPEAPSGLTPAERAMALLYALLWWIALPLAFARLAWRARREPGYAEHRGERLGRHARRPEAMRIWVHAVSVGETRAVAPLVEALAAEWPEAVFVLTHMTPAGRAAARQVFARLIDAGRLESVFAPYDIGFAVRGFLDAFRPRACLLMETEIWPNLIRLSAARGVAVALVNGRLSERSARRGRRFAALLGPAVRAVALATVQTEADASRMRGFGARRLVVCGNLKYDLAPEPTAIALGHEWRAAAGGRRVILLASTREHGGRSEEALLLDAMPADRGGALVVIVPRHPQRFAEVTQMAVARGLRTARRSESAPGGGAAAGDVVASGGGAAMGGVVALGRAAPGAASRLVQEDALDVWIGDSMGELAAYYAMADVAFVGGSLLPLGGQNMIEACACGCPVVTGPSHFNFAEASRLALEAGALVRREDAAGVWTELLSIAAEPARRAVMAGAASEFSARHRGATARNVEALRGLLGD